MVFRFMTSIASVISTEAPWWTGVPTKLVKKTILVPEGPDNLPVYTLVFAIPKDAMFTGRAKPHADVRIDLGDVVKMVIPNYKPKSYSMSALRENEFDITLKVYPNGRASGYLDRLKVGDEMNTFGVSAGRVRNPGAYVGIVAYGVGMTEGLPVAKAELEKGDAQRVVLLWASRTKSDTFWHDDIAALIKTYPDTFKIVHMLSREQQPVIQDSSSQSQECMYGRINAGVLAEVFQPADRNEARFLSVGTKDMMRITDGYFSEIGYQMPKHALIPKGR